MQRSHILDVGIIKGIFCQRWDCFGITIYIVQIFTATERFTSDASHTATNDDGGKASTTREFATCCISIDFVLNGRKVIAWILWIVKMIKL